jgi:cation diffusion facilitator CzcD-associated flavoprotein CzcO
VPSHFYSFSFALNPNWSRKFAPQKEIAGYLHDVAVSNDIPRHVRFLATVQSAAFDEKSGTWVVTVRDGVSGEVFQRRSRILISTVSAFCAAEL